MHESGSRGGIGTSPWEKAASRLSAICVVMQAIAHQSTIICILRACRTSDLIQSCLSLEYRIECHRVLRQRTSSDLNCMQFLCLFHRFAASPTVNCITSQELKRRVCGVACCVSAQMFLLPSLRWVQSAVSCFNIEFGALNLPLQPKNVMPPQNTLGFCHHNLHTPSLHLIILASHPMQEHIATNTAFRSIHPTTKRNIAVRTTLSQHIVSEAEPKKQSTIHGSRQTSPYQNKTNKWVQYTSNKSNACQQINQQMKQQLHQSQTQKKMLVQRWETTRRKASF